jgi:hypothetical protein
LAPFSRRHFFEAARTRVKTIGFAVFCESAQIWRELLAGLKARGLTVAPGIAVGDGALVRGLSRAYG